MKKVLCDLDGTLALNEHRQHFIEGANKDWDAFFLACDGDTPNHPIIALLWMIDPGIDIHIVSGRSDIAKDMTKDWLRYHDVPYTSLIMREQGDFTPDHVLKKQWIESEGWTPEDVFLVLDDRDKVVKMWRDEGFTCLQVADGDF